MGIVTPSKGRSQVLSQRERETEKKRELEENDKREGYKARKKTKTEHHDNKEMGYGRLTQDTFGLAQDTLDLNINSYSKSSTRGSIKRIETMEKLQEITKARSTLVREHSQDIQEQVRHGIINGSRKKLNLDELIQESANKPPPRRSTMSSLAATMDDYKLDTGNDVEDLPMVEEETLAVQSPNTKEFENYSPFILDMMKKHPKMMEKVNAAPKRKTALDMWP